MEEEFLNIGLDIIGLGVFNYDFGSISKESPVIKVSPNDPGTTVFLQGKPLPVYIDCSF